MGTGPLGATSPKPGRQGGQRKRSEQRATPCPHLVESEALGWEETGQNIPEAQLGGREGNGGMSVAPTAPVQTQPLSSQPRDLILRECHGPSTACR